MKWFKITTDDLKSAVVGPKTKIQYSIGEWTYPVIPNSKLFVYREDEFFGQVGSNERAFECEVMEPELLEFRAESFTLDEVIRRFWQGDRSTVNLISDSLWVVSAVKLIKEVK